MKISAQIDAELLNEARLMAAHRQTSLAEVVRFALQQQAALQLHHFEGAASGNYDILVSYSMGKLPRSATMRLLGLDHYGDLLHLMAGAGVPQPLLNEELRKSMVADMLRVFSEAGIDPRRGTKQGE